MVELSRAVPLLLITSVIAMAPRPAEARLSPYVFDESDAGRRAAVIVQVERLTFFQERLRVLESWRGQLVRGTDIRIPWLWLHSFGVCPLARGGEKRTLILLLTRGRDRWEPAARGAPPDLPWRRHLRWRASMVCVVGSVVYALRQPDNPGPVVLVRYSTVQELRRNLARR